MAYQVFHIVKSLKAILQGKIIKVFHFKIIFCYFVNL